jgi:hypothetical protein
MGSGVIKAQISSRTPCTAGRSAAEADEAIAAKHVKTKEINRKKLLGILLPRLACRTERTPPPESLYIRAQFIDLHQ